MTPQESSMLQDLVRRVQETQLTEKDPEAEQFLRQQLERNPDAIYILAQTVLVQNMALNQARAQLQELQQQQKPEPPRATSFLGGLLGRHEPAQAAPPASQYRPVPQAPQYQAPVYETPQYAPSASYPAANPSPVGGFLRSAATTAAGVAAGALAFEGIESLMHGFGHGGGGWGAGGYGSEVGAPPVEETVINNYYDEPQNEGGFDDRRMQEASFDDSQSDFDSGSDVSDDFSNDDSNFA